MLEPSGRPPPWTRCVRCREPIRRAHVPTASRGDCLPRPDRSREVRRDQDEAVLLCRHADDPVANGRLRSRIDSRVGRRRFAQVCRPRPSMGAPWCGRRIGAPHRKAGDVSTCTLAPEGPPSFTSSTADSGRGRCIASRQLRRNRQALRGRPRVRPPPTPETGTRAPCGMPRASGTRAAAAVPSSTTRAPASGTGLPSRRQGRE